MKSLREKTASSLQLERLMQGKSQQELAEALETSKSNISRLENGKQNMTLDYVQQIAECLGKSVSIIMEDISTDPYGDEQEYELKLYDETLMVFSLKRGAGLTAVILQTNEKKRHLFPPDLIPEEEALLAWLEQRVIPSNRDMVGKILSSLGLNRSDLKGIIDVCLGLSLNDSYWIVPKGRDLGFREYNLYENRFSEALSVIAYTGWNCNTGDFRTSPELTTGGMLRKAWRYSDSKGIWLYKGGTEGFANTGNEPYSEYYATQVAEVMGLNHVKYELENWKGILASKCRLFTDMDTAYVSIGRLVKSGGIQACLEYYRNLGQPFYSQLVSMLVFDAVIVNEDRHFGNFGILMDQHTGKPVSPAPLFDHGCSLLCYSMKSDYMNLDEYISGRTNPYGVDSITLARSVMGPEQHRQLRKLIGFHFQESDLSNLPTWRLKALEDMIQTRVKKLLEG